jgi:hypothetical protein
MVVITIYSSNTNAIIFYDKLEQEEGYTDTGCCLGEMTFAGNFITVTMTVIVISTAMRLDARGIRPRSLCLKKYAERIMKGLSTYIWVSAARYQPHAIHMSLYLG